MGKALKTVGVIIGGAALIATGVGAFAMPALAGSTTLFGVSVGTLNTISSGLIAVGGLLDKPKSQGSATPDEWTSNPDQPIPFLMGRMGVAGKIVQRDEFGPDNMYQGIVGILSGAGPIAGVTAFSGDKQPVTFGANGIAVTSQWQGEMWMVRRSGAQPDTALTVPAGLKSGGAAFEWSPAAKLSGKACYLQILGENSKGTAFPAGVPDPMHVADGIFGYDPRYDDTYPGGAGPCRLGVRSTYRWIDNGGIGGLNWALGLVENGQVIGGIGASIDGIDVPAFVEVANVADANSWKLAAWPDTSEDVSAVLDQLLQAAGAVRARHAGKISCVSRGAPRASVATITARDTAGDIELDTAPSLFNRLNTITPRFMSEAAGWVLTPANPVSFPQYVTDDGGKHSDQIDYRFVSSLKQAAELAAYDILDAREPFSGTIPLKAHMRHLKRGDTFLVSEPGFLMDGVKCIVLSRSYDPKTAQVRIGFRSETDSKHALALGKTTTLPDFPVLTPTDPTYVSPPLPGDWTITPRPPAPGGQLPGFDLGGIVSNDTATSIIVEHGPTDDGPWKQAYEGPPTVTNIPIDGLQPGATYYIAIQYRRDSNYSARHVYGPYVAPALIADVYPDAPGLSDIKADIEAAFGDIFDVSELLGQARTDLEAADAALGSAIGSLDTRADILEIQTQSLEENKASVGSLNAQILRINGVEAVNADQALALIDLENGKVALSEYNTLKGEVTAARDGAPSLLGQIQNLKTVDLDLQNNKSSVASVNALTARTSNTEADIIDLESALATETGARAEAIQQVTARLAIRRNEVRNATSALALQYWNGSGFSAGTSFWGPFFFTTVNGNQALYSDAFAAAGNGQYTIQIDIEHQAVAGLAGANILWFNGPTALGFSPSISTALNRNFTNAAPLSLTVTAPSNATRGQLRLFVDGHSNGYIAWRRAKVELGPSATGWTDDATTDAIGASVTEQSLAIIDLENNQAIAAFRRKVEATGGKPTILEMVSGAFGNYIALTAEQIFFGDNTFFEDATDTLQTTVGNVRYITAWGAPFGPDSLVSWKGPSNVGTASASKALAESISGAWEDSTGDSFFGGRTLDGPFDSGAPSGAVTSPPNNTWTTIASVDRSLRQSGYIMARTMFDILLGQANNDGDFTVEYRVAVTDQNGGNLVVVAGNFGSFPPNSWQSVGGPAGVPLEGAFNLASRGRKKIVLQINPSGASIGSVQVRNGRVRGLNG